MPLEQFWGTRVYREQPGEEMNRTSLAKFKAFHRFLAACLQALIEKHGACAVYDVHSYNITRQLEQGIADPPVFNLGTELLDHSAWGRQIEQWLEQLRRITLPGLDVTVAVNRVFFGRAYLCSSLTRADKRILVLPTEISKIYMDELQGRLKPAVVRSLRQGLQNAFREHTRLFAESLR